MAGLKKGEVWKLEYIVPIEDDSGVERVLGLAREYVQFMGFEGVETTFFVTSIMEVARNMLDRCARGMVGIRAISMESEKRLMFVFSNYWESKEDVRLRLQNDALVSERSPMKFSRKSGMTDEVEIISEIGGRGMIELRIRKRQ